MGKFITLEGIDGSGKSSNACWLSNMLNTKGIDSVVTREPGGTFLGEQLRELIVNINMEVETETLLIFAARYEHFKAVIEPSLLSGKWVISDRFIDATYAYQGFGKGLDFNRIQDLQFWIDLRFNPDITFLFDISFETMLKRFSKDRKLDKFEKMVNYFDKIRNGYLEIADKSKDRIKIIESENSIDIVQMQILEHINNLLNQTYVL
ncbi:dTMP kinase [Candidatus Kinetoplastibacterium desouzaii TCC079E]|uniref:Thymidylate kinase n=1 Tax=Candidatus Kinetoplastidibacterium desouzai TCC079E TaxID=1208919 RepID=M1LUB7_9PROT|nr:dTMP kinase [Candidatus Kinetoplastibacterium desouzaii TCC079E]